MDDLYDKWITLKEQVASCKGCYLQSPHRVLDNGCRKARIMIVGELASLDTLKKGKVLDSETEKYRVDLGGITIVNKTISELKTKIRALGNINVDAIEEYKIVSERYEFLSQQRDDLLKETNVILKENEHKPISLGSLKRYLKELKSMSEDDISEMYANVEYIHKVRKQELLEALESSEEDSKKVNICKKRNSSEIGAVLLFVVISLYLL